MKADALNWQELYFVIWAIFSSSSWCKSNYWNSFFFKSNTPPFFKSQFSTYHQSYVTEGLRHYIKFSENLILYLDKDLHSRHIYLRALLQYKQNQLERSSFNYYRMAIHRGSGALHSNLLPSYTRMCFCCVKFVHSNQSST